MTVTKPGRWLVLSTDIPSARKIPETDSVSSMFVLVVAGLAI